MDLVRSWEVAVERGQLDLRQPFAAVQQELIELLGGLGHTDWSRPTVLPGWDVHAVALHLLGNDLGRLAGAWSANSPQPEEDLVALAERIEAANEEWVTAARRIAPAQLVAFLRLTAPQVEHLFAQGDLWAPGTPVVWTGEGPSPRWLDLAREYTERWVHQAQIREAVGARLLDQPRWLKPLLDVMLLALPRAYRDVPAPPSTVVSIETTGPAGNRWQLRRGDRRWHLTGGEAAQSQARLALPAEVAWRRLAGMLPADAVERVINAEGEPALWRPALDAVAVMSSAR